MYKSLLKYQISKFQYQKSTQVWLVKVDMSDCVCHRGCQMAIARFLESYVFGPSGFWTMASLRYAAKLDPFLSLDCGRVKGVGAQSNLATLFVIQLHHLPHTQTHCILNYQENTV